MLQEVDDEEEEERAAAANDDGTGKDEVQVVEQQQQPPAKKQRTSDDSQPSEDNDPPPPQRPQPPPPPSAAVSVNDALNGIPEQWTGVSGITVQNELERLWEQYHSKRSSTAEADDNDDAPPSQPKTKLHFMIKIGCCARHILLSSSSKSKHGIVRV